MNNKIAVITNDESDILTILKDNKLEISIFKPGEINNDSFDEYGSIIILGGTAETPILLEARERILVEEQLKKGKRILAEYCGSIGTVYFETPSSTRYERLAFCLKEEQIEDMAYGDILDDQSGMRIRPHAITIAKNSPILQYVNVHCHKSIEEDKLKVACEEVENRALWLEKENLMICSFRLSNFAKARFSPMFKMRNIVKYILDWVTGHNIKISIKNHYFVKGNVEQGDFEEELKSCVQASMNWFKKADILISNGKGGVREGLATEIYSNGVQRYFDLIRTDCTGEVSLAYFMDYLVNGNEESLKISDSLSSFCFDYMVCREDNHLKGMMRWTNQAWEVCYQDDVARAIIPYMLKCVYTGRKEYISDCIDILYFLINTTGTDGTRVFRTDNIDLTEEQIKKLNNTPGNLPSAHYNAYYHAALLLGYKLTKIEEFRAVAVRGLTAIMKAYPETTREQSQTEEYCRLIFPLSLLYWVTGEEIHKNWLYKASEDLQSFKHSSGAYLEWDEGYKASMRNTKGDGECSLLSKNGDAVVDLLYSNNWLPLAFIQAYLVTKDDFFKKFWENTAKFMISSQIQSEDEKINGAWARGFDPDIMEYFGSPADAGWGPWAIESGWTVAEIAAGLMMGLAFDKIKKFY
ncbi:hypothetical protein NBE98_04145 [Clostridium swellfunianum]|uniref:hypothetical protein n=1 Tax=Clostridium swellfunianum TaxID=1367462 RepID=UPI00202F193B|nr:hypothetical protein [Clostridium swellfunianum]MCM0647570.1 hypothetical protein [Clostridium swellfunianum]